MASIEGGPKLPSPPLQASISWAWLGWGREAQGQTGDYFGFGSQGRWQQEVSSTTLGTPSSEPSPTNL